MSMRLDGHFSYGRKLWEIFRSSFLAIATWLPHGCPPRACFVGFTLLSLAA